MEFTSRTLKVVQHTEITASNVIHFSLFKKQAEIENSNDYKKVEFLILFSNFIKLSEDILTQKMRKSKKKYKSFKTP